MLLLDAVRKYGWTGLVGTQPNGHNYFVDENHAQALDANDGVHGQTQETPFATVAYAITQNNAAFALDAYAQNTIFIAASTYTENLTAFPKNCTVIGIGSKTRIQGYHSVSAAQNCRFHNIKFRGGLASTPLLTIGGSSHGISFIDCEFESQTTVSAMLYFTGSSSDIVIKNCKIGLQTAVGNSPTVCIHFAGVHAQRANIENNQIYSTGVGIQFDATMVSGNHLVVKGNIIAASPGSTDSQMTAGIYDKTACIHGGLFVGNYIGAADAIKFDASGNKTQWVCMGNWVNEAATAAFEDAI